MGCSDPRRVPEKSLTVYLVGSNLQKEDFSLRQKNEFYAVSIVDAERPDFFFFSVKPMGIQSSIEWILFENPFPLLGLL